MRYGRFDRKYSQTIEHVTVEILSHAIDLWLLALQGQIVVHNSGLFKFEGIEDNVPTFEARRLGEASDVSCTFMLEVTDNVTGKLWIIGTVYVTLARVHTCIVDVAAMPWAMHSLWKTLWFEPFTKWLASEYAGDEPPRQAELRVGQGAIGSTLTNPLGLTDKELVFADMKAKGRTEAEIASELMGSYRTVNSDVAQDVSSKLKDYLGIDRRFAKGEIARELRRLGYGKDQ